MHLILLIFTITNYFNSPIFASDSDLEPNSPSNIARVIEDSIFKDHQRHITSLHRTIQDWQMYYHHSQAQLRSANNDNQNLRFTLTQLREDYNNLQAKLNHSKKIQDELRRRFHLQATEFIESQENLNRTRQDRDQINAQVQTLRQNHLSLWNNYRDLKDDIESSTYPLVCCNCVCFCEK